MSHLRAFSRRLPPRTNSKRWLNSEQGRFSAAYALARETLCVASAIKAAAQELGITKERAQQLWRNED